MRFIHTEVTHLKALLVRRPRNVIVLVDVDLIKDVLVLLLAHAEATA